MDPALRDRVPPQGIQISGAHISGDIRVAGGELKQPLWIEQCELEGTVDMRGFHSLSTVSFNSSSVAGEINFYGARIDGDLELNGGTYRRLMLDRIDVGGQVNVVDSEVLKPLYIFDSKIGHALFFNRSKFSDNVSVTSSVVGGNVVVLGATLANLVISQTRIDGALRIGCQPSAEPANAKAMLGGDLKNHPWHRRYANESDMVWLHGATLSLEGTNARQLSMTDDAWPAAVDFRGFKYMQFVDGSVERARQCRSERVQQADWLKRAPKELTAILDRQQSGTFSMQPYIQLAAVLEASGYTTAAKDVLYAAHDKARATTTGWNKVWKFVQGAVTGYGQRPYRALYWSILLVICGALVFRSSEEAGTHAMPFGLAYSFDLLLPVVKLRELHYAIDLKGWRRYYFYIHKLCGWVLLGFIVTSIPGLLS